MNKCPQCSNLVPAAVEICSTCSHSFTGDVKKAETTRIIFDDRRTPEQWKKIKIIFFEALKLEPDQRPEFVKKGCRGNPEIETEVKKLLAAYREDDSFLEHPVVSKVLGLIDQDQPIGDLSTTDFVAGTVLDNRYRIIGLVGKGGMGEVYKAEDLKLEQTVALKFLPDKLAKNKHALKRFVGEVKIARQVSHENVCRVFDIGEIESNHYLSMEFIEGDDLAHLLNRIDRLPSDKAIDISRQICMGLHAIHKRGILHRDLKPGNIIIDSSGKARITDFGIAGFEEELNSAESRIGTPAYMSPEQITGKEVTQRSDIYALGLLIYEIFTGKQAVKADSFEELIEIHTSKSPTDPTELIGNMEPAVEKVINWCLEKDPADRPASAVQVALNLPGGNPLEVMLQAGETPSPEMVAAAPKKGALRPKFALGILITFIAVYFLLLALNQGFKTYTLTPLDKPPEVLVERSRQMLKDFGYDKVPLDENSQFVGESDFLDYYRIDDTSLNLPPRREMLRNEQATTTFFVYRSSPEYLIPLEDVDISKNNPPLTVPEMNFVKLGPNGRLYDFLSVPPKEISNKNADVFDWSTVFKQAGLNLEKFNEVEPNRNPPVLADRIQAWEGSWPDLDQVSVRIETAEFNGKPVFFKMMLPWNLATGNSVRVQNIYIIEVLMTIILFVGISWGMWLAYRNLIARRGDLNGSLKLIGFLFSFTFISELFNAHHVPVPIISGEISILANAAGHSLLLASLTSVLYFAVEPLVRRSWPEMLISWIRLLRGKFRDPLVGRDILIGGLMGLGWYVSIQVGILIDWAYFGKLDNVTYHFNQETLFGMGDFISVLLRYLRDKVTFGFIAILIAFLAYQITGKKWLGILSVGVIFYIIVSLVSISDSSWLVAIEVVLNAALLMFVLWRHGLLGMISFWFFFDLVWEFPVTFNTSSFYFPQSVFVILITLGLAFYAFYISTAGQPVFKKRILDNPDIS